MARTIEQGLAALRKLDVGSPAAFAGLREALVATRPGSGIVVAAAAKLVTEHRLDALVPELTSAFTALLVDPVKRDPSCRGKLAIGRALHDLDHWDNAVFVAGLHHVQREGAPGKDENGRPTPPDDTAAPLRGLCGLAHAHFGRGDALDVLVDLLADPERATRHAAAQGLGDCGRPDASAVLRYKLLAVGDPEPEVLSACFESLFALARDASTDFAIARLAEHDECAEAAALALGSARITAACDALVAWSDACRPDQRHRAGFLALALLRSDAANTYLLDAICTRSRGDALAAARALAVFKDDPVISGRIREALPDVKDKAVRTEIQAMLGTV